jgi:FtsZ-interacting cell division protein YlmF
MEPKDYEDLYRVGDSQKLRQMSIDNANMALNQAQRISGLDSSTILDYLKKEF